jgi:predicted lipoprotein with Yx(FWY)xxD motif
MINLKNIRLLALAISVGVLMQALKILPGFDFSGAIESGVFRDFAYGYLLYILPLLFIVWCLYVVFGKAGKLFSKITVVAVSVLMVYGILEVTNVLLCWGRCESQFLYPIEQIGALLVGLILPIGNLLSIQNGLLPIILGILILIFLFVLSVKIKKENTSNYSFGQMLVWLSNGLRDALKAIKGWRVVAKILIALPVLSFIGQCFPVSGASTADLPQSWGPIPFFRDGVLLTPYTSRSYRAPQNEDDLNFLPAYVYRGQGSGTQDSRSLDCQKDCTSGRRPLLSLRPGEDCTYTAEDQSKWKTLDDIRIHKKCASTPLGVIKRSDGKMQWAYDGHPIYFYPKDDQDPEADWEKIEMVSFNKEGNLVNLQGMTLYVRSDAGVPLNKSRCQDECLKGMQAFRPEFPFDWDGTAGPRYLFAVGGDDRNPSYESRSSQWKINDQFLYLSSLDNKPGDQNAVAASNGYWRTVKPQTPPFRGRVEVDREGKRRLQLVLLGSDVPVYVFDADRKRDAECGDACLNAFTPYLKSMSRQAWAGPLDQITIIRNAQGQDQWAYQGKSLYIPKAGSRIKPEEIDDAARRFGLSTIVVDDCYAGDEECRKKLVVSTDSIYWYP